jgi:AcrR family transcriptional regulator
MQIRKLHGLPGPARDGGARRRAKPARAGDALGVPRPPRRGRGATGRRTQEERSAETRGKLIEATIKAVSDRGYLNSTTAEIAERAGVSRGALQHQFRTKGDLLLAVLDFICQEFASRVSDIAGRGQSLESRCEDLVRTLWNIYSSPAYAAAIEVIIGARSDPEIYARIQAYRSLSVEVAERRWAEALSDVDVPPGRLSDILHFTVAALRGFSLHTAPAGDAEFYRRQLDLLRDSLIAALRAGAPGAGKAQQAASADQAKRRRPPR